MTWWQYAIGIAAIIWAIGDAAERVCRKLGEILIEMERQGPGGFG